MGGTGRIGLDGISIVSGLHVCFMVLQDKIRPYVAGSESSECTKVSSYLSMIYTWPEHGPDIGQSVKYTPWKCPVICQGLSRGRCPIAYCLECMCRQQDRRQIAEKEGNPHVHDAASRHKRASIFSRWLLDTFGR